MTCRQHVNRFLTNTGQLKSELARCLMAEFLGTLLFQIFGGAAPPKDTTAPAANGFALVCISECTTRVWLVGVTRAQPEAAHVLWHGSQLVDGDHAVA